MRSKHCPLSTQSHNPVKILRKVPRCCCICHFALNSLYARTPARYRSARWTLTDSAKKQIGTRLCGCRAVHPCLCSCEIVMLCMPCQTKVWAVLVTLRRLLFGSSMRGHTPWKPCPILTPPDRTDLPYCACSPGVSMRKFASGLQQWRRLRDGRRRHGLTPPFRRQSRGHTGLTPTFS